MRPPLGGIATLACVVVLALAALEGKLAQAPAIGIEAPVRMLVVQGFGERADGSRPGGTGVTVALAAGTATRTALHAERGTCMPWTIDEQKTRATSFLTWTVEAELVSADAEGVTVDVRWSRRTVGSALDSVEQHRTVRLEQQKSYVLDIVAFSDVETGECDRLVVEIRTEVVEQVELARAILRYDIWLVQRQPDGQIVTDRAYTTGRQGASVEYLFAPIHHNTAGMLLRMSDAQSVETQIAGTIIGRARLDGTIRLNVFTWRHVSASAENAGEGGGTNFVVQSGETVELLLPPLRGHVGGIDLSQTFARVETALRITATRVR